MNEVETPEFHAREVIRTRCQLLFEECYGSIHRLEVSLLQMPCRTQGERLSEGDMKMLGIAARTSRPRWLSMTMFDQEKRWTLSDVANAGARCEANTSVSGQTWNKGTENGGSWRW